MWVRIPPRLPLGTMKNDSKYEKARQKAYAPLIERVPDERTDDIFVFTLSCGLGWKKIVFRLVDELDAIWDGFGGRKGKENWGILQVKEKFGGLRFYVCYVEDDSADAKARRTRSSERIRHAEEVAWKTCERCGKPGYTTGTSYLATVCWKCEKRWQQRTAKGLWPKLFG